MVDMESGSLYKTNPAIAPTADKASSSAWPHKVFQMNNRVDGQVYEREEKLYKEMLSVIIQSLIPNNPVKIFQQRNSVRHRCRFRTCADIKSTDHGTAWMSEAACF